MHPLKHPAILPALEATVRAELAKGSTDDTIVTVANDAINFLLGCIGLGVADAGVDAVLDIGIRLLIKRLSAAPNA